MAAAGRGKGQGQGQAGLGRPSIPELSRVSRGARYRYALPLRCAGRPGTYRYMRMCTQARGHRPDAGRGRTGGDCVRACGIVHRESPWRVYCMAWQGEASPCIYVRPAACVFCAYRMRYEWQGGHRESPSKSQLRLRRLLVPLLCRGVARSARGSQDVRRPHGVCACPHDGCLFTSRSQSQSSSSVGMSCGRQSRRCAWVRSGT